MVDTRIGWRLKSIYRYKDRIESKQQIQGKDGE